VGQSREARVSHARKPFSEDKNFVQNTNKNNNENGL
jgi:hypothetical protein